MTTLIKNVQVVDGSGSASFKADILVRGPRIAALGSFPSYRADHVVYGNELFASAGFIDLNASPDRTLALFADPSFEDFVSQGITTVLMGHCGFSLAPSLYGKLHEFGAWARAREVNASWRSIAELLDILEKRYAFGSHIGTMAGHRVMREDILHNPAEFRKLGASELRVFRSLVSDSVSQGAFGLSFGLGYAPYDQTPYHEVRALADAVAKQKGLVTVHLRNEMESAFNSVKEIVQLAQDTSARTVISHLRPFVGFEDEFGRAIGLLEDKFARAHAYFDINPFPYSAVQVSALVPKKFADMEPEALLELLFDEKKGKEFQSLLPNIDAKDMVIFHAPDMHFLEGISLYEFAQNRQLSSRKGLVEFMRTTRLQGALFYKNLNREEIDRGIRSSQSLISTNSSHVPQDVPSPASIVKRSQFRPNRATATFPEFIRRADALGMPVEKAVAKITSIPASLLGLEKMGMLLPGFSADITLFSKDGSIPFVMVAGERVIAEGQRVKGAKLSGTVLRKKQA